MSIEEDFLQFHENNPHIWRLLVKFTREIREAGFEHYGIKAVFERIRWHLDVETRDHTGLKLNNNYTSRYARLLEQEHPEFEGFYRMRELKTPSAMETINAGPPLLTCWD